MVPFGPEGWASLSSAMYLTAAISLPKKEAFQHLIALACQQWRRACLGT